MKILFLCSSLELGRDGVGDYTRRLAGELFRQGHQACIIALYDRHLKKNTEELVQYDLEQPINTLRLSTNLLWKDKISYAAIFIKNFNPQWISLQYVPFGFHDKGLSLGLNKFLKQLYKGRKSHVMFHELWVGMDIEAPLKHILLGKIQRCLIKSLIKKINPKVVHTQTYLYSVQLAKLGICVNYLPLFGNVHLSAYKAIKDEFNLGLSLVIFGGIQPGSPIDQFSKEVADYSINNNVIIKLKLIGRCGLEQYNWVSSWQAAGLQVEVLGEQQPEIISQILASASIGITTTPIFQIEKSGSVAAMREHRLPIICVARSWHPRGLTGLAKPNGFFEYQPGILQLILSKKMDSHSSNSVSEVAHQFICSLEK